jgi:RimJ/RimL family protein N-acetyltransferase
MTGRMNEFGQAIGPALDDWAPRPRPAREALEGTYCRIEPLDPARHAAELFAANGAAEDGRLWTYLGAEPFTELESYQAWLRQVAPGQDPLFFAIRDKSDGRAAGLFAYMRIDPASGVIELGHVNFSPRLQRTRAATEAVYLMLDNAFRTLAYRRFEWKCDSLNDPSRKAALRFGFTYEGLFRQAIVYKGRSRDTAWFSILDGEWPDLAKAYRAWLSPENFDESGRQRVSLSDLVRTR